jgi:hypothetical protein
MKYAKIPKKYQITKKHPTVWRIIGLSYRGLLFDRFWYPKWILRPFCWLFGHKNRVLWIYGAKVKQCQRCAKVFYRKPTKESFDKTFQQREIGNLYGVRFITTKSKPPQR